MNTILIYIFWASILTFVGYVYNKIIYWIGAFFSNWADEIIINDNLWFSKNTTIKDIYYWSKYKNGYPSNSIVECYRDYCDGYLLVNDYRWIPGFNILTATIMFICYISKFTFALLYLFIKLIIFFSCVLWEYCLKWIWLSIKYISKLIYSLMIKLKLNNLYFYIKEKYNNAINILFNLKIS